MDKLAQVPAPQVPAPQTPTSQADQTPCSCLLLCSECNKPEMVSVEHDCFVKWGQDYAREAYGLGCDVVGFAAAYCNKPLPKGLCAICSLKARAGKRGKS